MVDPFYNFALTQSVNCKESNHNYFIILYPFTFNRESVQRMQNGVTPTQIQSQLCMVDYYEKQLKMSSFKYRRSID